MVIVWRPQMTIDGGIIDDDHKCLIGLVNEVESVRPGPAMRADLGVILDRLDAYARVHFEREERLQVATAFPYADAHHQRHRAIGRSLTAMCGDFDKPRSPQKMIAFHESLCGFLNHWLFDHILKVDLLMKPFAAAMGRHSHCMVSLAKAVQLSQDRALPQVQAIPCRQLRLPPRHR